MGGDDDFSRNYSVVNNLPVAPFSTGCCGGPFGLYWAQTGRSVSEIVNSGATTSNGSLVQTGDGQPTFVMSFNNAVTYHGLRLAADLDVFHGANIIDITDEEFDFGPDLGDSATTAKRLAGYFAGQDALIVLPGGFAKLRSVALNYNLPARWSRNPRHPFHERATLPHGPHPLLYAKGYDGVDPEVTAFTGADIARNVDITPYPPAKSYFLSLDLGF